jgi:hypothetical protein
MILKKFWKITPGWSFLFCSLVRSSSFLINNNLILFIFFINLFIFSCVVIRLGLGVKIRHWFSLSCHMLIFFNTETFCSVDVILQETFCYGDVLLRRGTVTFCLETFCRVDVLSGDAMYMCAVIWYVAGVIIERINMIFKTKITKSLAWRRPWHREHVLCNLFNISEAACQALDTAFSQLQQYITPTGF